MKIFTKKRIFIVIVIFLVLIMLGGEEKQSPKIDISSKDYETPSGSRSFYMGFSTWPPAATIEGINEMKDFVKDYSDITLIFINNGVPWQSSLDNTELPDGVKNKFNGEKSYIPNGNKVFVEVSSFVPGTGNLANNWTINENEPLPDFWKDKDLNDEDVKKAFLNYAEKTINTFDPQYFAIGIEVNEILENDKKVWPMYKDLHQFVYTELKKKYPQIKIFSTFVLRDEIVPAEDIAWLKANNDMLVLSTYPHVHGRKIEDGYFQPALDLNMKTAISETGIPSQEFKSSNKTFKYTEEDQKDFIEFILNQAQENNFEFVINFANLDYDKLLDVFPNGKIKELAKLWAYTGLENSEGEGKLALGVWKDFFNLPKK